MLDKTTLLRGLIHMPKVKNEKWNKNRYKTFIQTKTQYKLDPSILYGLMVIQK